MIRWPNQQHPRLMRGGGWESEAEDCRSAARLFTNRNLNKKDPQLPQSPFYLTEGFWIGFRIVSPLKEPSEAEKQKFWEIDDPDSKRIIEVDKKDRLRREIITPPAKSAAK